MANRQTFPNSISLRDSRGFVSVFRWWQTVDVADAGAFTDYATVFQAIVAAVTGLTNCAPNRYAGIPDIVEPDPAGYGATGQFTSVTDKALMTFTDSGGKVHRYHIPAPKAAIFDTDLTTVLNDGTQALVVAFVNAMKTAVGTSFVSSRNTNGTTDTPGLALIHFIGGKRETGKLPRRFNEFIKSSHLVQGEGE